MPHNDSLQEIHERILIAVDDYTDEQTNALLDLHREMLTTFLNLHQRQEKNRKDLIKAITLAMTD